VEDRGPQGWRPLHLAAPKGNPKTISLCLEHLADISALTGRRRAGLYLACCSGGAEIVRLLIDSGAEIEAGNDRLARPIHTAPANGHEGVVRTLLEKRANLNAGTADSRTVQGCAARGCNYALVEFLRKRA